MAVVLSLTWAGVTPEQYDAVSETVDWEGQPPEGLVLHAAWFDAGRMHVTDVWESQAHFERFFGERLAGGVQKAGISGQPDTAFLPLHRRFVAPGVSGAE
ncbi:hypothetical protein ACQKM2_39455 [Streptomyces sp. NPDC004126]|uniref:hypothetical protein n=1 Tax=Streptomyces sp. NPDC004126 TaxID=3390695 RepID=UPI003D041B7E